MAYRFLLWTIGTLSVLGACNGELSLTESGSLPESPISDSLAPCTDLTTCCSPENMVCTGDPDSGGSVCGCAALWDCSENRKKCQQDTPVPSGGGGSWTCQWSEETYVCTQPSGGAQPGTTPGGGGWSCQLEEGSGSWMCTLFPPNPANKPEGVGVWQCIVKGDLLVCERGEAPPTSSGGGLWSCVPNAEGGTTCTRTDEGGGLPSGGENWKCHQTDKEGTTTWICYGEGSSPPGGAGWQCSPAVSGADQWRCEKPEGEEDQPSGEGFWACMKGSEYGGTQCESVPEEPLPPPVVGPPNPGETCTVGEQRWCDGLEYCGWGKVSCDPATGTWKTFIDYDGMEKLDCHEEADGSRPNTVCACYFTYFNPDCCERPDCIIPLGSNGQICPPSNGGLCDYCNVMNPECMGPGSECLLNPNNEMFCSHRCSAASPCPAGYECQEYSRQGATFHVCAPPDLSCYY